LNKATGLTFFIIAMLCYKTTNAQNKPEFNGQVSAFGNYAPDNTYDGLLGGRYIPELQYNIGLDSTKNIDFEASANIYGTAIFDLFDESETDGDIDPYRIWGRYTGEQFEFRVGLQKIDFGSATILRPLQWFNQIDPRDPLQLTNGVYGALLRYYFLNNANIWVWGLYGNEKTRGFDALESYKDHPEFGGRVQSPLSKGEIALTYHHRTATNTAIEQIPENKFAIDGKWDVEVGLWFEASHTNSTKNIGDLTNQTLINGGIDYTFGIGNGLNVVTEHLVSTFDEKAFEFSNNAHITAATLSYPLGFFDNLSAVTYYSWETEDFSFFLNFEHQFKHFTGYFMPYYNPEQQQGIAQNELIYTSSGPGLRLMLVYNH